MLRLIVFGGVVATFAMFAIADDSAPPSIEYGASRTSTGWVKLKSGIQVAVDEGVSWKGVKVYLSLMDDLVAVEEATGETLWSASVGAFWTRVGFKEIDGHWAVELRPAPDRRDGKDLVQYHDLRTGEAIRPGGAAQSPGEAITPRVVKSGDKCRLKTGFQLLVASAETWEEVRERMFKGLNAPDLGKVDFAKEVVLVVYQGAASNCSGIGCEEAWECADRVLVRLDHHWFQSMEHGVPTRAWGVIVLPRRDMPYVLERNAQRFTGGPPIWKEQAHLELPAEGADALQGLPAE